MASITNGSKQAKVSITNGRVYKWNKPSFYMEKSKIQEIVSDQTKKQKENTIEREKFSEIIKDQNSPFVNIISGIRRYGKSTLLNEIKKKHEGPYVNFDDERFVNFTVDDFQKLNEVLIETYKTTSHYYFDEIQNIPQWEKFVRRLSEEGKKVYVTGSNATLLSKELGTHLTGRNIEFKLYPFSFKEYLTYKKVSHDNFTTTNKVTLIKHFKAYLKEGGLPEYLQTNNPDYLRSLFEGILYKDVMTRYKLKDERSLKELIYLAANSISKEISFNSIKKTLGIGSTTTVSDYFSYLENTYLLFLIPRYNFSLKKQIVSPKKLYMIDNALANQLGFSFSENSGKLLENTIAIELKRRNKEIYYHQGKNECDFLIRNNKIKEAIQVCYELNDNNKEREIKGLEEAMHTFKLKEGIIITMDQEEIITKENENIHIIPAWKWLLTNE
jgi:predicted AAA+ superfamily ATPase